MSRINYILTADGRSHDVSANNLDHTLFEAAVRSLRTATSASKVVGINLYNAVDAPFCLGSKAYASAHEAARNCSTRKGNHFGSFAMKITGSSFELNGGNRGGATYTRYAIWNGRTFEKPSYSSVSDARRANHNGFAVVAIGVRGREVVCVSAV